MNPVRLAVFSHGARRARLRTRCAARRGARGARPASSPPRRAASSSRRSAPGSSGSSASRRSRSSASADGPRRALLRPAERVRVRQPRRARPRRLVEGDSGLARRDAASALAVARARRPHPRLLDAHLTLLSPGGPPGLAGSRSRATRVASTAIEVTGFPDLVAPLPRSPVSQDGARGRRRVRGRRAEAMLLKHVLDAAAASGRAVRVERVGRPTASGRTARRQSRALHRRVPRADGARDGAGPRHGLPAHAGGARRALVRVPADVPRLDGARASSSPPGFVAGLPRAPLSLRASAAPRRVGCCSCSASATSSTCPTSRCGRHSPARRPRGARRALRLRRAAADRASRSSSCWRCSGSPAGAGRGWPRAIALVVDRGDAGRLGLRPRARGCPRRLVPTSTSAPARASRCSRSRPSCSRGRSRGPRSGGSSPRVRHRRALAGGFALLAARRARSPGLLDGTRRLLDRVARLRRCVRLGGLLLLLRLVEIAAARRRLPGHPGPRAPRPRDAARLRPAPLPAVRRRLRSLAARVPRRAARAAAAALGAWSRWCPVLLAAAWAWRAAKHRAPARGAARARVPDVLVPLRVPDPRLVRTARGPLVAAGQRLAKQLLEAGERRVLRRERLELRRGPPCGAG